KIMWFGFTEENTWYPLNIERVNHILRMNREGRKPATLDIDQVEEKLASEPLNSDLDRMDKKFKSKSKKRKKKRPQGGSTGQGPAANEGQTPRPQNQNKNPQQQRGQQNK